MSYRLEQFDGYWVLTKDETGEKWVVKSPLAAELVIERNRRDGCIVEILTLNDKSLVAESA